MADIDSPANPSIKALVRLRSRRERDATGMVLIDGARETLRAAAAGVTIERLFVCPELAAAAIRERLEAAAVDVPIVEVAEVPFRKAAYGDRADGVLALARQFPTGLGQLTLPADPLVLVVEAVEKPGNLGAMLRTAAAAGADAVILADPVTDVFNPNVIRASQGALFDVPLAVAGAGPVRSWLEDHGIARHPSSAHGGVPLWMADMTGPTALVVGAEDVGLSDRWLEEPDRVVRIPTVAGASSLNVATASGILLFEAVRQRTAQGG